MKLAELQDGRSFPGVTGLGWGPVQRILSCLAHSLQKCNSHKEWRNKATQISGPKEASFQQPVRARQLAGFPSSSFRVPLTFSMAAHLIPSCCMRGSEGSGSPARTCRLHPLWAWGLSCRVPGRGLGRASPPACAHFPGQARPGEGSGCNWAAQLGSWEVPSDAPRADNSQQTPAILDQWVCPERMIAAGTICQANLWILLLCVGTG